MAITYRVLDMRADMPSPAEITVESAASPEAALRQALGLEGVRSGRRKDILARIYWQPSGQPMTMVRLYRRVAD